MKNIYLISLLTISINVFAEDVKVTYEEKTSIPNWGRFSAVSTLKDGFIGLRVRDTNTDEALFLRSGLQRGDIILKANDVELSKRENVRKFALLLKYENEINFTVIRNEKEININSSYEISNEPSAP